MRKLLILALCVNAVLLAWRCWQELPIAQGVKGTGPLLDDRYCADSNGDGSVDVSDAVTVLNYLFGDVAPPPYCIAQSISLEDQLAELESRIASVEATATTRGFCGFLGLGLNKGFWPLLTMGHSGSPAQWPVPLQSLQTLFFLARRPWK